MWFIEEIYRERRSELYWVFYICIILYRRRLVMGRVVFDILWKGFKRDFILII